MRVLNRVRITSLALTALAVGVAGCNTAETIGKTGHETATFSAPAAIAKSALRVEPSRPRVTRVAARAGAWTCSPSGFGQTSRCFQN